MSDRSSRGLLPVGLVAAVAAVIYALLPGGGAPSGVSKPQPSGTATAAAAETGDADPLKPLTDFLSVQGTKPVRGTKPGCRPGALYPLRFLIATVPDPIDSHLVPSFDRALDAIQSAMQAQGYVLDSFSLPWKRDGDTRKNARSASSGPSDLQRRVPGTLLFRSKPPEEDLVLVFLVGEKPTSGVQRQALTRALDVIAASQDTGLPCVSLHPDTEIGILGPYFSGSTPSLRNLLGSWNGGQRRIRIVSGSATVDDNARWLRFGHTDFNATVIPDGALSNALFDYLEDRLDVDVGKDVAMFVEGGTSYGSSFEHAQRGPHYFFRFPLHVSQLRGAYQKNQTAQNPNPTDLGPRQALELPLDPTDTTERDALPPQDPRMAANIADLALTSSVETIRRKEIRLVGIAASDPRDILFLARKIRETGANVTLFTFGADILYTHPDYERYLRGMLVVTPYPLFPANQAWSDVTAVQVAFAGSTEEGIYNAMLTLVPPPPPASVHPLIEYQAPMQPARRKPPIWIMAVGRNGFWPVAIAPNYRDKDHVLANSSRLSPAPGPEGYRPPGAILAYVLLEFLFIGVIASYLTLRRPAAAPRELEATPDRRSTIPRGLVNRAETILSIWSTTPAREINGTYLATLLTLIALVQATLALCVWRTKEFQHHATALLAGALFMLACLLGLAVREWIRLFRGVSPKSEKGLAWRHARVPVAILAGVGLLLVPYWAEICALDVANVVPFFARALDLTSTLSPVLPFMLVFLVLALWAFCNMERAFLLEVQCDEGLEPGSSAALAGLQELQTAIRNLLADPNSRTFTLLVPILAFVPFYRLVGQPFDSIDGSRWSRLFEFCLLACYFVIVHSVTLFVTLWLRVRRLLQRLSWHPVAEAFQRLPESVAASPWRMLRPVQSLTGLEVSVSQLWTLVHLGRGRLDEDYRKQLELRAQAAQTLLDLAVDESSRSFAGSLPTQRELRTSLAEVTARLLEALEEAWRQGPGPRGARIEPRRVDAEQRFASVPDWLRGDVPGPSALWVRAAEEFVALHFFSYLRGVFLQIKNVLSFAFLGFVLAIAAVNSYPFQPKHPVMALIWIVALVCLALVAWAFIEMDRDRILSYIGKTTPGQTTLSREFLSSMAIYVLVPLLTLLATQFPALGEFIFSVFSPAMKSLR